MKRGSNGDAFLRLLERIRNTIPGVMLRTSFIVGFPGETAADFRELCDFVRAAEFDWMGVFAYSDVDNAASYALEKKVDAETIAERRDHLMAMQRKHFGAAPASASWASGCPRWSKAPRRTRELVWEARLQGMAPEIDGKVYLNDLEPADGGGHAPRRPATWPRSRSPSRTSTTLVGRVVEIRGVRRRTARPLAANAAMAPVHKISTGAALRVLA